MCLAGIWEDTPITGARYRRVKCRSSCRHCISICSFSVRGNYNIFLFISLSTIYFNTINGKCIIYDIMFYIQDHEQFDMGVRPTPSAEPQEETQVNFYVF